MNGKQIATLWQIAQGISYNSPTSQAEGYLIIFCTTLNKGTIMRQQHISKKGKKATNH
jgi:hypothetical protein